MIHKTPIAELPPEVRDYVTEKKRLVARFRKTQQQRGLRNALMRQNPHCDNCGQQLQNGDPQQPFYAHVSGGRLSCQACVPIVRALAAVELPEPAGKAW